MLITHPPALLREGHVVGLVKDEDGALNRGSCDHPTCDATQPRGQGFVSKSYTHFLHGVQAGFCDSDTEEQRYTCTNLSHPSCAKTLPLLTQPAPSVMCGFYPQPYLLCVCSSAWTITMNATAAYLICNVTVTLVVECKCLQSCACCQLLTLGACRWGEGCSMGRGGRGTGSMCPQWSRARMEAQDVASSLSICIPQWSPRSARFMLLKPGTRPRRETRSTPDPHHQALWPSHPRVVTAPSPVSRACTCTSSPGQFRQLPSLPRTSCFVIINNRALSGTLLLHTPGSSLPYRHDSGSCQPVRIFSLYLLPPSRAQVTECGCAT